jgi:hypothetical protein
MWPASANSASEPEITPPATSTSMKPKDDDEGPGDPPLVRAGTMCVTMAVMPVIVLIMLMAASVAGIIHLRGAEHCHSAVADVLVDAPAEVSDDTINLLEEGRQQGVDLLGVKFGAESREAGDIDEQNRDLSTLALGAIRRRRYGRGRGLLKGFDFRKNAPTVTNRGNADFSQVVYRQGKQRLGINMIVVEGLRIGAKPERDEPFPDVRHHAETLSGF